MPTAKTPAAASPAAASPPNTSPIRSTKLTKLEIRSQEIWEEARTAIAAVGQRRGWPCETDADINQVIDRLDAESGEERPWFWIDLQSAVLFRNNVGLGYMDRSEMRTFYPVVQKFIKRLESL